MILGRFLKLRGITFSGYPHLNARCRNLLLVEVEGALLQSRHNCRLARLAYIKFVLLESI